jgi:hypothetical protein
MMEAEEVADAASVAVVSVGDGLATSSVLVVASSAAAVAVAVPVAATEAAPVAAPVAETEAAPVAAPVAVAGRGGTLTPLLLCGRDADRLCGDESDARGRALVRREKSVGLNHAVAVAEARSCGENGSGARAIAVDDDEADEAGDWWE